MVHPQAKGELDLDLIEMMRQMGDKGAELAEKAEAEENAVSGGPGTRQTHNVIQESNGLQNWL